MKNNKHGLTDKELEYKINFESLKTRIKNSIKKNGIKSAENILLYMLEKRLTSLPCDKIGRQGNILAYDEAIAEYKKSLTEKYNDTTN